MTKLADDRHDEELLGCFVGVSRARVSGVLPEFKDDGVIELHRCRTVVVRGDLLRELCSYTVQYSASE